MKIKHYVMILAVIFVLSLIPMYVVGIYDHPSVDDYYYGVRTSETWKETGSMLEVFKTSFHEMKVTYQEWQGNFAAIFLMRLQPGIYGESAYVWSPVILITCFVIAMPVFFYVSLRKWFEAGKTTSILVALTVTFCAMQFTYVPSDSFYWFNGSIYYTFFFSLMLLLFTAVTVMVRGERRISKIFAGIFALFLAFLIGGGNYATALFTVLVLFSLTAVFILKKDKSYIPILMVALVSAASLIVSMAAPGNAIRQEAVGGNSGVVKALVYSFAYGGYNIANATTVPVLVMWIVLLPLFYRIVSKCRLSFRCHPILVALYTFGLYCSQGTPVFFAQGLRMPYRMMNIIYFSYYLFATFNLLYLMGYIRQKQGNADFLHKPEGLYENVKHRFTYIVICVLVFAVSCVGVCKVSEKGNGGVRFSGMPLSVSAAYSIVSGDAANYDRECRERIEYINSSKDADVVVKPYRVTPEPIFHTDITSDPEHWKNVHMALFYQKDSIRLSE